MTAHEPYRRPSPGESLLDLEPWDEDDDAWLDALTQDHTEDEE